MHVAINWFRNYEMQIYFSIATLIIIVPECNGLKFYTDTPKMSKFNV